jgi:2,3-bisphosphoglycerate-independent phosphoglycerate mutase
MNVILVISDGLGDVPCPSLSDKTPLEAGSYPTLDRLAREGITGIMDPLRPGIPAGSDTAHIAIFGENPFEVYSGRGYLEALGVDLEPSVSDIGFRVNFGTVEGGVITDRRAGRDPEGLPEQVRLDVPFMFREATGTRAALVLQGDGLSSKVSDGDPHVEGKEPFRIAPLDKSPASSYTAHILNDFIAQAQKVLSDHPVNKKRIEAGKLPANYLLVRGAGVRPLVQPLPMKYGVTATCIAATALIRGVAKCFGLTLYPVKGITGEYNTDTDAKARAVIEALKTNDFVFAHFKATDTASHDGDPAKKMEMIGRLDSMLETIVAAVDPEETVIALTGDHTTPCMLQDHAGEPVPIVIWGGRVRTDDVTHFDERSCAKGGLTRISAMDIVPILMNQSRRIHKFGE